MHYDVYKISYFFISIELGIVLADEKYIQLNLSNWEDRRFVDYGPPPTSIEQNNMLFPNDSYFTAVPHFTVIENDLNVEDHIYFFSKNLNQSIFHLYDAYHPDAMNYRFKMNEFPSMEKCSDKTHCQKLKCTTWSLKTNKTLFDKVAYVSFFFDTNVRTRTILLQYMNLTLKCVDIPDFNIKKFVWEGSKKEQIASCKDPFKHTTIEGETTAITNHILNNSRICLQIFQCMHCKTTLKITCNSKSENTVVFGDRTTELYSDNSISYGWNETCFCRTGKENDKCNLTITRQFIGNKNTSNQQFWTIMPKAYKKDESCQTSLQENVEKIDLKPSDAITTTITCYLWFILWIHFSYLLLM